VARAADVDTARIINADTEPGQWLSYGRTYDEQRFSPLRQITTDNVRQLGLAWHADYASNLQQEGTPLYIDGVIYVSIAWTRVYAFDARTGRQLWLYDPKTPKDFAPKICCGIVNRGIAAYNGKIYLGTLDGYLVAVNAATGEEVWRTLTVDPDKYYSITSAPRVAKGKVFIGNSGGEFGVRGYIGAYDAETGEPVWRFYTVPGNPADGFEYESMRMAAATWGGEWWTAGGGGTVWDAIVYDDRNDLLIFGTGNGTPWNQLYRDPTGGDNLFLASIIAVKPDTGEYVWHYQTTPADTWDYDAVSPMTLADVAIAGAKRRVLMQPCKNGFMYVLDAATGELLKADPFTTVNWADGVDLKTGRPNVVPAARYTNTTVFNLAPGYQGAHGWHANAYHPGTGLLYIATQAPYALVKGAEQYQYNPKGANLAMDFSVSATYFRDHPDAPRGFAGYLQAWDPAAGKEIWRGEENQGPTGGALATAGGLVFQGGGSNNRFRAYHAQTGEKLWEMDAQTAVLAPPISFELDGTQYVAVSVGGNSAVDYYASNYSRLLVFSLGAARQLPPTKPYTPLPLNPPPLTAGAREVEAGQAVYDNYCALCHGANGTTRRASFPNLLVSPLLHTQEGFDQVVLAGVRAEQGMAAFAGKLRPEDSAQVRAYLIARANEELNAQRAAPRPDAEKEVIDGQAATRTRRSQ
jgi:PQQ-dependent dehydrogenase (methanol/ethanol family)